jgi:Putative Actinobacterial Holin-X, holin superfamily III
MTKAPLPDVSIDQPDEPSVPELAGELAMEVATLVKQELALAAAEMERKAHDAARNVGHLVIGTVLGTASVLVLTTALVLALATVIPAWASALVIAAGLGGAAYATFRSGWLALRAMSIMPTETFASLRDDRLWAKQQIESTRDQMSATLGEVRTRLKPNPPTKKRAHAKIKRSPA